jgi:hypothetical protein
VQVFLPFPSFTHSVAVLDRARLGKQRIECGQILSALRFLKTGEAVPETIDPNVGNRGSTPAWLNHPATKMWRGYEAALGLYMSLCIAEWIHRGYKNSMVAPYDLKTLDADPIHADFAAAVAAERVRMPPWLGREDVHASHRANLLRKMPEHYGQFGWTEDTTMPYVWPVE